MRDESKLPAVLRKKLPPNLEKIRHGQYKPEDWDYPVHLYLRENDIRIDETGSDIVQFLRGKSILITGATGFLGKLLVEKLLRCCKDIDKIYLIVRPKKGKDVQTRIQEYFQNWVFVKLEDIYPNFRDKVIGINGDFSQQGIGLSEESRKILTDKVNIIYHIAATVRFDENLKSAVTINIKGTREIIKLAKDCKNLDVLMYMSTAFSNCHQKYIEEKFYEPVMDPQVLIDVTERLSLEVVERITPGLLGDMPNTYAFTKQIAEDIVRKEGMGLPVCIQRPSIVIAAAKEPIRSWVDNIYGPVGLIEGAALGLLHVMIGDPTGKCNMVPADYVVNNCIALSYKTAKERLKDKIPIYNYTVAKDNPLYWKDLGSSQVHGYKLGSEVLIFKGFFRFTKSSFWYYYLHIFLHLIPAYIFDFVAVRIGKEPQLVKAYTKIGKYINALSHFTLNTWTFENDNVTSLRRSLNDTDKEIFQFDNSKRNLDWQNYFDTYLVAMREFLVKEFLDNLEEGRAYKTKLDILCYVSVTLLAAFCYFFCLNKFLCFIPIIVVTIILYYWVINSEPY